MARGKECIEKLSEKIEIVEDISDNEDDSYKKLLEVLDRITRMNWICWQHKDNEKIK